MTSTVQFHYGVFVHVDTSKLKDTPLEIIEGCKFSVKIQFRVQREIVCGLRYNQKAAKMGFKGENLV